MTERYRRRRAGRLMRWRLLPVMIGMAITLTTLAAARAADVTPAQADGIARGLGDLLIDGLFQRITTPNAQQTVPGYTTAAQPSDYYQGGQGQLNAPGASRVQGCAGMSDTECQAVNLLKNRPQIAPQFHIDRSDPLLVRYRALYGNPGSQLGDLNQLVSGESACRTDTVTLPAQHESRVCNDYAVTRNDACVLGRKVEVDADHLYRCLESIQNQAQRTCTVGRVIQVSPEYNYQCSRTLKAEQTMTCGKQLIVTAVTNWQQQPGCSPGQLVVDLGGRPGSGSNSVGRVYCGSDGSSLRFETGASPNQRYYLRPGCNANVHTPMDGGSGSGWWCATASRNTCNSFCASSHLSISCSGGWCAASIHTSGNLSNYRGSSGFTQPTVWKPVVGFVDSWDNQCRSLEARQ